MNLEGRIPFDYVLCYQTCISQSLPCPSSGHGWAQTETAAGEPGRVRGARQGQGSQEGFPQLRECMYSCSDRVTSSKSISKGTWTGRKGARYLLHLHQGIFPSWCLGLCALSYMQPLRVSLTDTHPVQLGGRSREKIKL